MFPTHYQKKRWTFLTLGILLDRRVDSSSLVVLMLSSLRLVGEEGTLRWDRSNTSSWLCLLDSRGSLRVLLSMVLLRRSVRLLGFGGSFGR